MVLIKSKFSTVLAITANLSRRQSLVDSTCTLWTDYVKQSEFSYGKANYPSGDNLFPVAGARQLEDIFTDLSCPSSKKVKAVQ